MPRTRGPKAAKSRMPRRFLNDNAELRYEAVFKNKQMLYERGFRLSSSNSSSLPDYVLNVIAEKKWTNFCQQQPNPDPDVVREFYSNLLSPKQVTVVVREVSVPFSAAAINQLYGLEDVDDEYTAFLENEDAGLRSLVLAAIAVPGSQWTVLKEGTCKCKHGDLVPAALIWFYFLRHSIMPTTHTTHLSFARALLIYCLLTGKSINLGRILEEQIKERSQKRAGDVFFPCLVSQLCMAAGVPECTSVGPRRRPDISPACIQKILHMSSQSTPAAAPSSSAPSSSAPNDLPPPNPMMDLLRMSFSHQQDYWRYAKKRDDALRIAIDRQFPEALTTWAPFPDHILDYDVNTESDDSSD